jgi:hypothetical protein
MYFMKRLIPFVLSFTVILVLLICVPSIVHAQPDPCVDPDLQCPIDGGLTALLAIGAGYGIKKYRDARKSIPDDETVSE